MLQIYKKYAYIDKSTAISVCGYYQVAAWQYNILRICTLFICVKSIFFLLKVNILGFFEILLLCSYKLLFKQINIPAFVTIVIKSF